MKDDLEEFWKDITPRLKGGRSCRLQLVGKVFGRLRVVAAAGADKHGASLWKCLCECGTEKVIQRGALKSGRVKSCGCLLTEYKKSAKRGQLRPIRRPPPRVEMRVDAHVDDVSEVFNRIRPSWDGTVPNA